MADRVTIDVYKEIYEREMTYMLSKSFADKDSKSYFERGWRSRKNRGTHIALCDGELVGAVTAWKTEFHPYCTYISIATVPSAYETFVQERLLRVVEKEEYPLQTSLLEVNNRKIKFYENNNFAEIRRTYFTPLAVCSVEKSASEILELSSVEAILSLEEIESEEILKEELLKLIKKTYVATHQANPPKEYSLEKWESVTYDHLLLDKSYVVIDRNQQLKAFALLYQGEDDDELEFGWRGTDSREDLYLIDLLTAKQILEVKAQGGTMITGEIDSTDFYSMRMKDVFQFEEVPALVTYQKMDSELKRT